MSEFRCSPVRIGPHRQSLSVAFVARADLFPWLALGSGLSLTPKGYSLDGRTLNMNYVELPLRAVLQTGPSGAAFFEGGMIVGYRATCERLYWVFDEPHRDECGEITVPRPDPLSDLQLPPLRPWDVSWSIGAGGRVAFARGWVTGALRFQRSILDLSPDAWEMHNQVLVVSLGYERRGVGG